MSRVRYIDDDFEERDGQIIEHNGNLTLVEDLETGDQDWRAPFEVTGSYGASPSNTGRPRS